MIDFHMKNRLLVLLDDDATAYAVAADFVTDEAKLMVFERQYAKTTGDVQTRAATAATIAAQLWEAVYAGS